MILEKPLSVFSLSRLPDVSERFIHTRLNSLHPVLTVPDDKTSSVRLFHLSFRDFILNPEIRKKTPFWVDEKARHCKLTKQCLRMCHNLRRISVDYLVMELNVQRLINSLSIATFLGAYRTPVDTGQII